MLRDSCIFVAEGVKIGLQFGRKLEELAHGVRPGRTDILILEHEEIAIPRPRMYPPKFMWIAVISTKVGPRLRSELAFAE